MSNNLLKTLREKQPVLIITHENPDGDALGASFGVKVLLDKYQIVSSIYLISSLPTQYLELMGSIKYYSKDEIKNLIPMFNSILFLDMADLLRSGIKDINNYTKGKLLINVDHHISNTFFGDENFVDPNWSSTCEGLVNLLMISDSIVDKVVPSSDLVDLFLLGVLTDTGYFSFPNVSEKTMETVGFLIRNGASLQRVNLRVRENMTDGQFKAWGYALLNHKTDEKHGLIWSLIPNEIYVSLKLSESDTEGLVEFLRNRKNCKLAILFKETKPGFIRISLRSKGGVDANLLAAKWGGGGHPQASGFTLNGNLDEIEKEVIDHLRRSVIK